MAKRDWTNILFLASAHLLALAAVVWLALVHFSPWTVGLACLWFALCGVAITGGYHRLFAHPTYRANIVVRAFYLLFGAAAVQNSALKWSIDHRLHHAKTDREEDPYNISRGFWWAHIGWVFFKDPEPAPLPAATGPASRATAEGGGTETARVRTVVKDLEADPLIRWQDRHYVLLAFVLSGLVPLGLGFIWHDPIGALLVACFLRLVVQWQATFAVNSFAHWIGKQPYSRSNSARDSFWTALITLGEGYHNFHHRFQTDYRNGVRWYHFDPTKWFVWTLARVGLTWDLRRTPPELIQRARVAVMAESQAPTKRQPSRTRV